MSKSYFIAPQQSLLCIALAMGSTALTNLPIGARAQALPPVCNVPTTSPNPVLPPAPRKETNTPQSAINLNNSGETGCRGSNKRPAEDNANGGSGQPGGDASQTSKAAPGGSKIRNGPLRVRSDGGTGGVGSSESRGGFHNAYAARGGVGGAGGVAFQEFDGQINDSSKTTTVIITANGGDGGASGNASSTLVGYHATTDPAGVAGAGGDASLVMRGGIQVADPTDALIVRVEANGGNGGDSQGADAAGKATVRGGGAGGNAGKALMFLAGDLGNDPGTYNGEVQVMSTGGDGGFGGRATSGGSDAISGTGGAGGDGGSASGEIAAETTVTLSSTQSEGTTGVLVQSNGGRGGAGGFSGGLSPGEAGGGGRGGDGGAADFQVYGSIQTRAVEKSGGSHIHGALVQSIGGAGSDGGSASAAFFSKGGAGLNGGKAGKVTVTNGMVSRVRTDGPSSVGIIAQSVGGGGGSGGNAVGISIVGGALAIGGNAGAGGEGAPVTVTLGSTNPTPGAVSTITSASRMGGGGVLAQSIGGAGGAGGSAAAFGGGNVNVAVGGDGKKGAQSDTVEIVNNSTIVTTYGDHATGLQAQSVGGGGGKGGSGFSLGVGEALAVSVSVGGSGGSGGPGGASKITNLGQVLTFGPDSAGVKAQSIGGGGGHGGAARATAFAISQAEVVPAFSMSFSIGGKGGQGNTAGPATLTNKGFVATGGHGSVALFAQSVGGGGGFGGDSSSSSFSGGGGVIKMSVSAAVGGKGGSGATGGVTTVENDGILATFGQSAPAILAQSIGGGGGYGGAANVGAQTDEADKFSFAPSVGIGGSGGIGGTGQEVIVTNRGGIGTRGDASDGIFAQSIGGGGGLGGGGDGNANGDTLSVQVDVGGSGGGGNDAAYVAVSNFNTIVTSGISSAGIHAQSIGGGGGRGGKGGSTAGGAVVAPDAPLTDALGNGLNSGQETEEVEPGVIKIGPISFDSDDINPKQITDFVGELEKDPRELVGDALNLSVSVGVGGTGGAGGQGNEILLENSGRIVTSGALSNGLVTQSIGGGGGAGGASTASTSNDNNLGFSASVGGGGGSAGDANTATINTLVGSQITTSGAGANGIIAQSIGGGGGIATIAGVSDEIGPFGGGRNIGVTIGGKGGASGSGGKVAVNHQGGMITTHGKNAIGIVAQSIGGGGGLAHAISTLQFDPDSSNVAADKFDVGIVVGGDGNKNGAGGAVNVLLAPNPYQLMTSVSTAGRNAHGVLAQSIGASGGAATGGKLSGTGFFSVGHSGSKGNGGNIGVTVSNDVFTSGAGASGIFAQSIGGGGGVGGDLGSGTALAAMPKQTAGSGDGGAITLTFTNGQVTSFGANAPAVFVQSLGGGGGHFATKQGLISGAGGAPGKGGAITINVGPFFTGSVPNGVYARGKGSDAISAQSAGANGGSQIIVNNTQWSNIQAGEDAYAIRLRGGDSSKPNTIKNEGGIAGGAGSGGAVWVDTATNLTNSGMLKGSLTGPVTNQALMVRNLKTGVLETGNEVRLGTGGVLNNAGLISVGGEGHILQTQMVGDLKQSEFGRLVFDIDAEENQADQLIIEGAADLDGTIAVNPISLLKAKTTVLSATNGISRTATITHDTPHLFSYQTAIEGRNLVLTTDADFGSPTGLSSRNRDLADNLQGIWDSGDTGFGLGFAALANVSSADDYDAALNMLSGRAVSAIAASRYDASLRMVNSAFSCPTFVGDSARLTQKNCAWTRLSGSDFDRDASGDSVDYSGRSSILMFGGQYELDSGWLLGGVVGYENSSINSTEASTNVDGQAGLAVLALKRQMGPFLIGGALDLGYGTYDSRRNITFGDSVLQARASSDAFNAGLHFKASYQRAFGTWYVEPQVDLDMTYLKLGGFQETGAGAFDLDVSKSSDILYSTNPAVKLGRRIDLGSSAVLNAFASVGMSFRSGNDWRTNARFVNAPSSAGGFSTKLNTPDTLRQFSAGVEIYNQGGLNFRVQYDTDLAANFLSQRAELRLSINF